MAAPVEQDDHLAVSLIIALAILLAAVIYFLLLFISALTGLVSQLANPAAKYDSNATIFVVVYPVFLALGYAFLPELPDRRRRLRIASRIAILPTVLLPLMCGFLLPTVASYAPWSSAGTLFLVFCGLGVLPTLAVARLVMFASPEVRVGNEGDHYIDVASLSGDTRRIVAKRTNGSFKRPPALHRLTLWGDGGRLTHGDVLRLIELETEELDRVTAHADAATRQAVAEFRRKRSEMLAAVSPELALWLSERARAGTKPNALLIYPEDANG